MAPERSAAGHRKKNDMCDGVIASSARRRSDRARSAARPAAGNGKSAASRHVLVGEHRRIWKIVGPSFAGKTRPPDRSPKRDRGLVVRFDRAGCFAPAPPPTPRARRRRRPTTASTAALGPGGALAFSAREVFQPVLEARVAGGPTRSICTTRLRQRGMVPGRGLLPLEGVRAWGPSKEPAVARGPRWNELRDRHTPGLPYGLRPSM